VADTVRAVQRFEVRGLEGVADEAHLDVAVLLEAVVCDDTRGLLSAVLEGVEGVVERAGGVTVLEGDADNAALLVHGRGLFAGF
jgi:hypothetical protein